MQYIALSSENAKENAELKGYEVERGDNDTFLIKGPDNYKYKIIRRGKYK